MKIRQNDNGNYRSCNECRSEQDVKELVIGKNGAMVTIVALCRECREELAEMLSDDYFDNSNIEDR